MLLLPFLHFPAWLGSHHALLLAANQQLLENVEPGTGWKALWEGGHRKWCLNPRLQGYGLQGISCAKALLTYIP